MCMSSFCGLANESQASNTCVHFDTVAGMYTCLTCDWLAKPQTVFLEYSGYTDEIWPLVHLLPDPTATM